MSDTNPIRPDSGDRLTQVFFSDLPGMAGIVTVVTQPFAQESMRTVLRLPEWIPIVVALGISALLALYKILIMRRSAAPARAICVPFVALVVFAAYATGNNVVYYAKEGLMQPLSAEQAATLKRERDNLEQQVKNSEELIGKMRRALGVGEPEKTSARPEPSAWARLFGVPPAEAQPQPRRPEARDTARTPGNDLQRLKDELRKFDVEQRQLKERLETIKPDVGKAREQQQQQPLIKSW